MLVWLFTVWSAEGIWLGLDVGSYASVKTACDEAEDYSCNCGHEVPHDIYHLSHTVRIAM